MNIEGLDKHQFTRGNILKLKHQQRRLRNEGKGKHKFYIKLSKKNVTYWQVKLKLGENTKRRQVSVN
uniref:Uncharacterized protein n=1 Tax=Rhizophora mucronata TaxID=61149 RepID=A0A2P2MZL0_RHIMU